MDEKRDFSGYDPYDDLDRVILHAAELIANQSPIDTGNLRINAINVEWIDATHMTFRIYIDEEAIRYKTRRKMPDGTYKDFDYATWLNESPDSPHRGWWERACIDAVNYIKGVLG